MDRRRFLLLFASSTFAGCKIQPPPRDLPSDGPIRLRLFRSEDRFSATLEIYGFRITNGFSGSRLVAESANTDSRLFVFTLPPQHNPAVALERTQLDLLLGTAAIDDFLQTVGYLSSKPTKLVFKIPSTDHALPDRGRAMPFDLDHLLAWEHFEFVLPDLNDPYANDATFGGKTVVERRYLLGLESWKGQGLSQTSAIDLPSGFYFQPSPDQAFHWKLTPGVKKVGDYFQSWSAFLVGDYDAPVNLELVDVWGVAGGLGSRSSDAIVSYDYVNSIKKFEFAGVKPLPDDHDAKLYEATPVDFYDRIEFATTLSPRFKELRLDGAAEQVVLNYRTDKQDPLCHQAMQTQFNTCYVPLDHHVTALTYGLGADGGYLDLKGNWSVLPGCTIKGLAQQTNRGEDTFVQVVRKGYLYPYGFDAELVDESETTYIRDSRSRLVAPLVKQTYVRLVKPTIAAQFSVEECFTQIEVLTPKTPPLDPSEIPQGLKFKELDAFIPRTKGQPFRFEFEGTDITGKRVRWQMPAYFLSNRQTDLASQGRFLEDPSAPCPVNALGAEELRFIKAAGGNDCNQVVAPQKINFIKLIDQNWSALPYRFAPFSGEVVALASAPNVGETSVEMKWAEWVRSVRPADLTQEQLAAGLRSVLRPMSPRIRTARIALQGLRQFAGSIPDMLGTYRDMRRRIVNGDAVPLDFTLDPEETQHYDAFHAGVLSLVKDNQANPFFCVLPVGDDLAADQRIPAILRTYYAHLPASEAGSLFDGLSNLAQFGRARNTEGLGALSTPDSPISLLTCKYGPLGDARQSIGLVEHGAATPKNGAGLMRAFAADNGATAGQVNMGIGDLFGPDSEIIPGVKFRSILSYVVNLGGDAPGAAPNAVDPDPVSGSGPPRWSTRITGLDWFTSLLAGTSGVSLDAFTQGIRSPVPSTEPASPVRVGIEASLEWDTSSIKDFKTGIFDFLAQSQFTGRSADFSLSAKAWLDLLNPHPQISATCSLKDFSLVFFDAIIVEFDHVQFELDLDGNKRFDPAIANISFGGALQFINGLKDLLKSLDDEFGLKIELSPARVSVSQTLSFPVGKGGVVMLGPATISNLTFNWGVIIPILGRDRLRVFAGLASREKPMTIAVGWYGGRAHALIECDTTGPRLIEVSADYGGVFQASWGGIAEGSVSLTAGFSFTLKKSDNATSIDLFAFAQFSGKLSIVRIFSVCANVMVGLGYKQGGDNNVIYGEALCSCSFSLGLIKYSYQYSVYKEERAGGGASTGRVNPWSDEQGALFASLDPVALPNRPSVSASGSSCACQQKAVPFFYPFQGPGQNISWQEFFDAIAHR